jgi:hypothetical protein
VPWSWVKVSLVPQNPPPLPDFTRWPSFPFEGDLRVKHLAEPVAVEPPRSGEDASDCVACNTPDDAYIWASDRWRVRGMDRPTGLPIVLILECRSHLDIGDLPNLLAAELGVMTVRLERAIRSLDGVARVHVNRWGDGSAHLHMWFLARPYGRLQLRGTFLSLWDDILPVIPEEQWLENLALVAEWLAGFGGRAIAEPPHIHWQSPSTFGNDTTSTPDTIAYAAAVDSDTESAYPADTSTTRSDLAYATDPESGSSAGSSAGVIASRGEIDSDLHAVNAETRDLSAYYNRPASTAPAANGNAHAANELTDSGEGESSEGDSGDGVSGQGDRGDGVSGEGDSGDGVSGQGDRGEGVSGQGDRGEGASGQGDSGEGASGQGDHGEATARNELDEGGLAANNGHRGGSQLGDASRQRDSNHEAGGGQAEEADALNGTAELRPDGRPEGTAEPREGAGPVGVGLVGSADSPEGAGSESSSDLAEGAGLEDGSEPHENTGPESNAKLHQGRQLEGIAEPREGAKA